MGATVITTWLTSAPDPNRGDVRREGGSEVMAELRASLRAHGAHLTVLHDCLDDADDEHTTFVRVSGQPRENPYFMRWAVVGSYLLNRREIDDEQMVWMVDATDVVMLNPPPDTCEPGTLYVGSEETTLAAGTMEGDWMRGCHPSWRVWLDNNAECRLLNPGIVGGQAGDVWQFAQRVLVIRRPYDRTDMAAFNWVARSRIDIRLVTGPMVHSPFRAMKRSGEHWWAHK